MVLETCIAQRLDTIGIVAARLEPLRDGGGKECAIGGIFCLVIRKRGRVLSAGSVPFLSES